jgi:hypothetical protein
LKFYSGQTVESIRADCAAVYRFFFRWDPLST